MTETQTLPAAAFVAQYPPNHWNESEDWMTELREQLLDPFSAGILTELIRAFQDGEAQVNPVIVDPQGVVDGHSRTLALWIAGLPINFEVRP